MGRQTSVPGLPVTPAQAEKQQYVINYPSSAFQAGRDSFRIFPLVTSSFPAQPSRMTFETSSVSGDNASPPSECLSHPQSPSPFHVHTPYMFHSSVPNSVDSVLVPPLIPRRHQPQSPFDTARMASPYLSNSPDPHSVIGALVTPPTFRRSQPQRPFSVTCTASLHLFNSPDPHSAGAALIAPVTPRRPQLQDPFSRACTSCTTAPDTPRAVQLTQEPHDRLANAFNTSEDTSDNLWGPPAPPKRPLPQRLFSSDCRAFSSDCNDVAHMGRPVQSGKELLHKLHSLCDTAESR